MKKVIIVLISIFVIFVLLYYFININKNSNNYSTSQRDFVSDNLDDQSLNIENFNDCLRAGNAVMESYPRQCRSNDGHLFVEDIGNILEKNDLIRLNFPMPNQIISSPLEITGEARGYWYFEADFPVLLLDSQENIIARGIAVAKDDWMTEKFVPFSLRLEFDQPASEGVGRLILEKDNPSGLVENDDSLNIPVIFR